MLYIIKIYISLANALYGTSFKLGTLKDNASETDQHLIINCTRVKRASVLNVYVVS